MNPDSHASNNCIHMSFPTGSHLIIAGPGIFWFYVSSFPLVFGGDAPLVSPAIYPMAVHHDPFYLALPPVYSYCFLNPLTLEIIPNLPTLHIHNTPLSGFYGTDFKDFLACKPRIPPLTVDPPPFALPPLPRYLLSRARFELYWRHLCKPSS